MSLEPTEERKKIMQKIIQRFYNDLVVEEASNLESVWTALVIYETLKRKAKMKGVEITHSIDEEKFEELTKPR